MPIDPLIDAASRALATGDPLAALRSVALRDDAPALALRGIAMAQLGDFAHALALLRRAARSFGTHAPVARARCQIAEAEIRLASRDLARTPDGLTAAQRTLLTHGDLANAAHAQFLLARYLLLVGRIEAAEQALQAVDPQPLPPALQTAHALTVAGVAMRRVHARAATVALARAEEFARRARVPALTAEVETAARTLAGPAARLLAQGQDHALTLIEVEALLATPALIIDACRYAVWCDGHAVPLGSRPVLFTLARALAEAAPGDVSRDELVARAFRLKHADASLRARLRVEVGRLRKALVSCADVVASARGFALRPRDGREVVVLAQPVETPYAALLALLADGEAWSSSALALALGVSQRNVQRALDVLASKGALQSLGRGRTRRWLLPPLAGFTTSLLLPAPLPSD